MPVERQTGDPERGGCAETPFGPALIADGDDDTLMIVRFLAPLGVDPPPETREEIAAECGLPPEAAWDDDRAMHWAARLFGPMVEPHGAIPVLLRGSSFSRDVWRALLDVPTGTTISYGDLACRIGRPGAARAVGAALRANRIAWVVPCHRVVGACGSMTGFASGIERKRAMLAAECPAPA